MEAHPVPDLLSASADSRQAQFTTYDYGREGDQRPYQVVMPSYEAPQFLSTFHDLAKGLRECGSLCRLSGKPFRLVKWGAKVPCLPCGPGIRDNKLPHLKVRYSRGAIAGYPEASPIAEVRPGGTFVFGPHGGETLVGRPNYIVSPNAFPEPGLYKPGAPKQSYIDAVKSAQYLAGRVGRRTYVCAGFGSSCKGRGEGWMPVVYADPGGLVARYPYEPDLGSGTVKGSTNVVTGVTPSEYRELLVESEGGTLLPNGV